LQVIVKTLNFVSYKFCKSNFIVRCCIYLTTYDWIKSFLKIMIERRAIYGNLENKINTLYLARRKFHSYWPSVIFRLHRFIAARYFRRKYKSSSFLQLCLIMLNQNTHTHIYRAWSNTCKYADGKLQKVSA
jgi:hypothetical protein